MTVAAGSPLQHVKRPYLADCNCSRFAMMAAIRARNVPISLRRSWRSGPGGSLRADSNSFAAISSRSCIFVTLAFRYADNKHLLTSGAEGAAVLAGRQSGARIRSALVPVT
jgi:hypothetical protein